MIDGVIIKYLYKISWWPLPPAETFEPCGHPGTPTYGIPNSNKLQFQAGDTLHYSCMTGHQLLGEPVLHCIPGHPSQWSGLPPVCKGEELQLDVFFISSVQT